MSIRYIIVADGGEGVIFKRNSLQNKLEIIKDFFSEDSHKHNRDLDADRQGRTFDSVGQGHHAIDVKITNQDKAKIELIKNIVNEVKEHYQQSNFDELIIIAPPEALGNFREQFSKHAHQIPISRTIEKDLTKLSSDQVISHLDN